MMQAPPIESDGVVAVDLQRLASASDGVSAAQFWIWFWDDLHNAANQPRKR